MTSKSSLRDELLGLLRGDLEVLERAQTAAREGATHEEAKPENDKDTRALEASYLARGQSKRIEELKSGIADVVAMQLRDLGSESPVALGALVVADEDGSTHRFFLAPYGGGAKLNDGEVQVVTPKSPLGRALLGLRAGDACEVELAGKTREMTIARVA